MSDPNLDDLVIRLTIGNVRLQRTGHHKDASIHGYSIEHRRPDDSEMRCTVGLQLCDSEGCDKASHDLVQANPLTISPSLGCPVCGWHVYIREGAIVQLAPMIIGTPLEQAKNFPLWNWIEDNAE